MYVAGYNLASYHSFIFHRINHTVILDDPFDDPEGLEFPDKSPEIDPYKLKVWNK